MTYIMNKLNTSCLFHDVSQWDERITRNMCTIYYVFINAKYNWVIKDFTEDDIKTVAKSQADKGLFDYNKWAYTYHSTLAVIEYLKNKWITCNLFYTKRDSEVYDYLDRWYAVWVWLMINKKFIKDRADGSLDLSDYSMYQWSIWHATNLIKWTCRGKFDCEDNGKEMFLDSYFTKNSTYTCDIKKVLENIDQATKYVIF